MPVRDLLLDRQIFWFTDPGSLYVLLQALEVSRNLAAACGMLLIAGLRLAAIWWDIQLPVLQLEPDDRDRGGQ